MSSEEQEKSDTSPIPADGGSKEAVDKNDASLDEFLSFIQDDSAIASFLFAPPSGSGKNQQKDSSQHRSLLLKTCQSLFQTVESLSQTLESQVEATAGDKATTTSLSGLEELYLGTTTTSETEEEDPEEAVDGETIWGQIELQNEALQGILKKSVKKLGKLAQEQKETNATNNSNKIQLLDLQSAVFEGDEEKDDDDDDSDSEEGSSSGEEETGEDEDSVTRRMKERMRRAMEDQEDNGMDDADSMDGEEDEQEDDEEDEYEDTRFFGVKKKDKKPDKGKKANAIQSTVKDEMDEDLVDPAAEELNNGFFDINEMEAFADEEEDMLPEQVWDPTPPDKDDDDDKNKTKKSFHQRQREGMDSDNDDDDDGDSDEEDNELMLTANVKRKKYREDDEIEALYGMYKATNEDEEEGELADAVNMTAADLFGAPNKKYFHKWKGQQEHQKQPRKVEKADDDSWDAYDFDKEKADWGVDAENAAKKQESEKDDSDSDDSSGSSTEEEDSDDSEDQDKKPKAKKQSTAASLVEEKKAKSKFKQQQEKLRAETERLEQELIKEKPWQMMGEASSSARPVNSLLEGTPEFKAASKVAPVITEEHTANLEDVIKQRIMAEDWDDIIPRELPDVAWNKKRGELPEVSQEKAKLGLGELYEREYLKKAVGYDADAAEKESEEEKAKNEMKQLFANICSKLDALSNYNFAPRPVADEAEVRAATTPAIAMEEVLPLHVSDARGAAPEEVYGKKRGRDGILRSDAELEQSERKRIRAGKKAARRKARKQKETDNKLIARVEPGLGLNNPYEKRKAQQEMSVARAEGRISQGQADANTGYGSSNKFFRKLQDDVSKNLRDEQKSDTDPKETKRSRKSSSFKL
ncbi:nucleolar ribonucleoprotein protein MPP10 [Seminavis robusta]|uniref:Nucleolar ribonucleoprotein protein MPP10 n=1 Tax=Seminavis robusta TaxID=568900 RepID=A0A9N8EBI9_9STRA|nr:nucleolar ribonucleoprotein protein MPP10 [Seminavis robusta]|eukprot:Sro767_g199410.1 nucleolar ribonucleoprotein protein MPP10 (867) ;mRNA; r:6583-9183